MQHRILIFTLGLFLCTLSTFAQTCGNASYYSHKLHGRTMSNGKPYHKDSLTCAHLKYPLGTKLLVRNPANSREVVVTVTDRGPFSKRFLIDLSFAAAKQLDIVRQGVALVEIVPYTSVQARGKKTEWQVGKGAS